MLGISTLTTCSEACWYAREDVCRCQCGGKNHGILRDGTGERPARTRRVGKARFKLVAVVGYSTDDGCLAAFEKRIRAEADKLVQDPGLVGYAPRYTPIDQQHYRYFKNQNIGEFREVFTQVSPTKSQRRWAELAPYAQDTWPPALIWQRVEPEIVR